MYPPLSNDITTSSANDEYPPPDYNNSPFLQDHDGVILSYLLSQQHFSMVADVNSNNSSQPAAQQATEANQKVMEEMMKMTPISCSKNKKKKKAAAPRKRPRGKKDRHSKIYTAQGQRDRRMRLSVQIARKFFDLQDMLGFDKGSKTIEWLITKSKSAIKELKHHLVLPSYSTCTTESSEVVSNILETRDPKKHVRKMRRVAKGSRDEARARARERTREKLRIRSSQDPEANPNDDLGLCLEQGVTNSMTMSNTNDQKTLTGRSSRSGPHFDEDGGFAGFTGNWGNIDSTKMQSFRGTMKTNVVNSSTGNSVLQIENPSTPIMGRTTTSHYTKQQEPGSTTISSLFLYTCSNYSQEQSYSGTSVFITPHLNTEEVLDPCSVDFRPNEDHNHNPNSIFTTTLISQDQNPAQFLKFNQDHFKFM